MAFSKIEITFVSIPQVGDNLVIGDTLAVKDIDEGFVVLRAGHFQTTIGDSINNSAFHYQDAVSLDYNSGGLYTITQLANVVTIEATQDGTVFSEDLNNSSGRITVVITNETATGELTIDTVTFSEADSDPCNNVKVNVTTSELATIITSPVSVNPNTDNPFDFDWVREVSILIECETATLNASLGVSLPAILSVANMTLTLVNSPTGATLTVTHTSTFGLTLEYSLDNFATTQSENTFTGLAEGSYIVYVRDQLGCSIQKDFFVSIFSPDISVREAFTFLGKEMSFRFKRNQVWDDCTIQRNEHNTLSCEEKVNFAYPYYQKFQTCDVITTQFLSNYETLEANIIQEDGTKIPLNIVKRSNFLDVKDSRDATYYDAGDGKTGVYFTTGDTYDYDTGVVNGTYALNGKLPVWGAIGNYIFLDGIGWFQIEEIIFNDDVDADVLIFTYLYTGIPTVIKVSSNYNIKNYEVYEFVTDFVAYEGETLQVDILQTDNSFGTYNYLSEQMIIKQKWEDTVEMIWYNPTDTFIFYSTGIQNKARLDFDDFGAGDDSSLDLHKTPRTSILISADSYENSILSISEVSTGIKRQLTKAVLHKELFIDNIQYVSNAPPEPEPMPFSNMYGMKFNLTKTGDVYNSEFDGTENGLGSVEVVGLVKSSGSFLKA